MGRCLGVERARAGYRRASGAVLCVDGGSCDGTVDIIKQYESDLAWWVSAHDKGPADAINKAMRYVNGEIVAVLDADDLLAPFALQHIAERFAAADEPD